MPETPTPDPEAVGGMTPTERDARFLRCVEWAYQQAHDQRRARRERNIANWDALAGKFAWTSTKIEGQSAEVLPTLPMGLERIASKIASTTVGLRDWFRAEEQALDLPPELGDILGDQRVLSPDVAAKVLQKALERMYLPGNQTPSTFSPLQLIYLATKRFAVESEWTIKVSVIDEVRYVYLLQSGEDPLPPPGDTETYRLAGSPIARMPVREPRLRLQIVPYEDSFPDPSPHGLYWIHEVTVHRSELGQYGYDADRIRAVHDYMDSEADTAKRAREGASATDEGDRRHTIRLREYWGDFLDPATGEVLERNVMGVTCGPVVVQSPKPNPWWHGRQPRVTFVAIPNDETAPTAPAFLDWAAPLHSTRCELTNLVIDGGFNSVHGVKEFDDWRFKNPDLANKGIRAGMTFVTQEGAADGRPGIRRIDVGTLQSEVFNVLSVITTELREALQMSELDAGQLPEPRVAASGIVQAQASTAALFDAMAARQENAFESVLELAWSSLWQALDRVPAWMKPLLDPQLLPMFEAAGAPGRFLATQGTSFKIAGFQQMRDRSQDWPKLNALMGMAFNNPALLQVFQQKYSPLKMLTVGVRALGIDTTELERDANEPMIDPQLLAGMSGNPGAMPDGKQDPAASQMQQELMPPNPTGDRGGQV